jgi:uncharacterized membrane protein YphA (DoxX/SURF4 family)
VLFVLFFEKKNCGREKKTTVKLTASKFFFKNKQKVSLCQLFKPKSNLKIKKLRVLLKKKKKKMGLLRTIGIIALVAFTLLSGVMMAQDPKPFAANILKGNLPELLKQAQIEKHVKGFKFGEKEATILAQATGGAMAASSLFIIVGLGRAFFAFLLALLMAVITVCQHLDIKNPQKTTQAEQIQCWKNLALIGGLLILAGGESVRYVNTQKTKKD